MTESDNRFSSISIVGNVMISLVKKYWQVEHLKFKKYHENEKDKKSFYIGYLQKRKYSLLSMASHEGIFP